MKKLRPFVFSLLLNKDFFISDRQPNHHRYQDSYYGKRYGSRRSWRHQNYDQGRMPKSKQSLIKNVPPFFFTFFKIIFFKLNFFIRFFYFQTLQLMKFLCNSNLFRPEIDPADIIKTMIKVDQSTIKISADVT